MQINCIFNFFYINLFNYLNKIFETNAYTSNVYKYQIIMIVTALVINKT